MFRFKQIHFQFLYSLLAAGILLAALPVDYIYAQEGQVSVESRLDKSRVTVGELVLYEIVITFSPDVQVAAPPPGINLGGFEIREYEDHDPVTREGLIEKRVEFYIAAYDTGTFVIPPTGIVYLMPDSTQDILFTDAVTIRVESVLSGESDDIQDIKEPLELPLNFVKIIFCVGSHFIRIFVLPEEKERRKTV